MPEAVTRLVLEIPEAQLEDLRRRLAAARSTWSCTRCPALDFRTKAGAHRLERGERRCRVGAGGNWGSAVTVALGAMGSLAVAGGSEEILFEFAGCRMGFGTTS